MGYTIIKNGDTPNVQYNQYVCGSYADLSFIKNPVEGSIAYVPENGGVNEYIAIGGKWVNKVIILEEEPEDYVPIHSDWNENDSESPNFINNRTHWIEQETVANDYEVDWLAETPPYSPQNWDCTDLGISLEEDVEYTLIADGQTITGTPTKIELDVGYIQKHLVIGNLSYLNGLMPSGETYEDNGFPMLLDFATEYTEVQNTFNLILTNEDYFGNDLAFSIGKKETTYHKLPINFVFDSIEIFSENTILQLNNVPIYDIPSYEINTNGISEGTLYGGVNVIFTLPQTESIEFLYFENPAGFTSPEYMLEFITGSTAPTLELPIEGVSWVEELTLEANKHYQISIMNGIALWCAVDVEVEEEEEES